MKKIILILLILVSINLFCQDNTALKQLFEKAKESNEQSKFIPIYENLSANYLDSYYGQLALLELAKIYVLERKYSNAIKSLKMIHHQDIADKQYWLAKAYLKEDKLQLAVVSAQIFISESDDNDKIENAYFIIAEAYIQQNMYKRAFNTLETLRTSKYINNNIPLLHFKMGNCKEFMGKYDDALMFYKKLKKDFPYHQYSYLAEDRLFELKSDNKINVSLSNINSYRQNEPKQETEVATGEYKVYLQVGAFSSEERAIKLGKKVKQIGYDFIVFSKIKDNNKLFVVAAGPFEKDKKLKEAMKKLEKNDLKSYVIKRY
jgi:TolA-binding protein